MDNANLVADVIEIEQLLATLRARHDPAGHRAGHERRLRRRTAPTAPSATTYQLHDFPALVEAAPKGLYFTGTPVLELDGDSGTGQQTLLFIDQTNHHMRMGWYSDTYVRTEKGWRLRTRSMTFLRRSGEADAGKAHDPLRPEPTAEAPGT